MLIVGLTSLLCPLLAATLQRRSFGRKGRCGFHFLNSCSSEYSVTRSPVNPNLTVTLLYVTTQLTVGPCYLYVADLVDMAFSLFLKSTEQSRKCIVCPTNLCLHLVFCSIFGAWCFQAFVLRFQHVHVLQSRLENECVSYSSGRDVSQRVESRGKRNGSGSYLGVGFKVEFLNAWANVEGFPLPVASDAFSTLWGRPVDSRLEAAGDLVLCNTTQG